MEDKTTVHALRRPQTSRFAHKPPQQEMDLSRYAECIHFGGSDLVSQRATDPFATMLESEGPGRTGMEAQELYGPRGGPDCAQRGHRDHH